MNVAKKSSGRVSGDVHRLTKSRSEGLRQRIRFVIIRPLAMSVTQEWDPGTCFLRTDAMDHSERHVFWTKRPMWDN